ncbi:MAG: transposase [Micromonosporaceae bacterium]|nr:transposase [Micromonosporaceae bacterium]
MTLTIADTRNRAAHDGVVSNSGGPRAGQPRKRVFTSEYKLRMVAEYDALQTRGDRGALLRREGLYHSHVIEWRKARDAGTLTPAGVSQRGDEDGDDAQVATPRRRRGKSVEAAELERLRKLNEKLARDLARTQTALDIMGKAHALLEMLSESAEPTRGQKPTE